MAQFCAIGHRDLSGATMPLPATDRPRRDQAYVPRSARAVADHIMAVIADPTVSEPTGQMPFMTLRVADTFGRIIAACMPRAAPAEASDVRSSSVLSPPRQRRRR